IEPNRILTHIGFDEERRCGSCTIQRSERARRTMHDIAHTIHIDDAVIVTDLIDKTLQLTNHAADSLARRHAGDCRWCAWQIAMAIASAASSVSKLAFGSKTFTIMWICFLSPWPTPITDFFTALGAYSATRRPARAGTSIAMPLACPSFSVAVASLLTKVDSTAASCGI